MTKNPFHSNNGPPGTTSTFERRSSRAAQIILENIYGLLPAVSFPSAGSAIVIVLSSEKRLTLIDGEVSRTAGSTVYTAILPRIKAEWFFSFVQISSSTVVSPAFDADTESRRALNTVSWCWPCKPSLFEDLESDPSICQSLSERIEIGKSDRSSSLVELEILNGELEVDSKIGFEEVRIIRVEILGRLCLWRVRSFLVGWRFRGSVIVLEF